MRQLKGESWTAAEVVMDDALTQDDGFDLVVEELYRCWEVTQDQDRASKIEKALFETQRDVKTETTFMSYVARRKLNCQQLENALGTPLPTVIMVYAALRDAKLAENSNDKVVMWTGGSYEYDDAARALVRLDRPGMQPLQVPSFGHNQVATDRIGTRSSTHCKRTSTSARKEKRRSPAMERLPFRVSSTVPTMVRRRPWNRMQCHTYCCKLDQPFDILGTGLSDRNSTQHRSLEVSLAPDVVQVAENRDHV